MRYFVIFLLLVSSLGCYADNLKSIVQANDNFTVYTFESLPGNDNLIFSGLSAEVILTLLANGAGGTTREQLLSGLSLPHNIEDINKAYTQITSDLNVNEKLSLKLANKIFVTKKYSIKKQFNDVAVNNYAAEVEKLDFDKPVEAANQINSWVEEKTNNKIKNLIDSQSLKNKTGLVLVNALYFSGQWKNPFPERGTDYRTFHSSPTESKKIPTMYSGSTAEYTYNDQLKAKFLKLGFKDSNITMTFVLPDQIDGLKAVEKNLEPYLAPQYMEPVKVYITLPKFKIETKTDFKPILKSLGVEKIFEKKNDFSNIPEDRRDTIQVDFVIQKAFIDIHENGVEAAAASAIGAYWSRPMVPPPSYEFNADHPFIFIIKENNGLILFAGRFTG